MTIARIVDGEPVFLAINADVSYEITIGEGEDAKVETINASWQTINAWSEEDRNAVGLYSVQEVNEELGPDEKLGEPVLTFEDDVVTSTRLAVPMTTQEIASRNAVLAPETNGYKGLIERRIRRLEGKGDVAGATALRLQLMNAGV